jgi:hypothetical protein
VRTAYGEVYGVGDHIGVLLDLEQGHLSFFKNGTRAVQCRAVPCKAMQCALRVVVGGIR